VNTYQPSRAPAYAALAFLAGALALGFVPVLWLGLEQGLGGIDPYIIRVLSFTLLQAGLSTLLSLALGLPLARALARQQRFLGRGFILRLLNLPLVLPAITVIIGIIEVYGAKGWLGGIFDIYGLKGIVLAHVFFNVPLAARLILSDMERIPPESWKLAAQLGLSSRNLWRIVEWPQIRGGLAGAALLIFLLCAASFAIVLTLGGGPRATTLEVAIYQSLRADFDPPRAAILALMQLALCATLALLAQRWGGLSPAWPTLRLSARRYDAQSLVVQLVDGGVILLALALLLPPLAALAAAGLFHIDLSNLLLRALATSLALGGASALLAFALAWPLSVLAVRSAAWRRLSAIAVLTSWIVPPAALATGWFISFIAFAGSSGLAAFLVIAMNALMSLPFAARALVPALARSAEAHDRLCLSLGIAGWTRFRLVELPVMRRAIGVALVLSLILSLGDLTAISLFGTQDFVTLPALIYRQMGSYRFDAAIGTALVLALLVLALSSLAERWGRAA
jgi:thiamine transport system permease protein